MDAQEVKLQAGRIAQFQKLESEYSILTAALAAMETPTGIHKQSACAGFLPVFAV